jgi:hypothetical protein
LFGVCVNDVVLRLFIEMDIKKWFCFEKRKNYFVCVLENLEVCGLCVGMIVKLCDFGN